ncbi:MAG TPA: N-6 DNA methylase [Drouetiella sp.]
MPEVSLADAFASLNEFPFANLVPDNSFNDFNERAKELLNGCSPSIEMLGGLYEHIHKFPLHIDADSNFDIPTHIQEKDKRRLAGQFYTPASIVDYCFERALEAHEDNFMSTLKSNSSKYEDALQISVSDDFASTTKILDPACGTGNFLLGAIRIVRQALGEVQPELLLNTVYSNVFGAELDGRATCLARICVLIALLDCWHQKPQDELRRLLVRLRSNIVNTDTLFAAPEQSEIGDFAIVITNPPYVSFGARNQPKLSSGANKYLRNKFPASTEYKIRVHSIFQEIALRYTAAGGVSTLLVPDGFLTGGYYKNLRQCLLRSSRLCSFAELPVDTVPGAVVGRWCVATYKNQSATNHDYPVRLFSRMDKTETEFSIPKSILVSKDQNRFRLVFNEIDMHLAKLIDRLEPLSSEFTGHSGIRALHGQNSIVSDRSRGKTWKKGIVSGTSVLPHVVTWTGTWIHVNPRLLYKGGFDPAIMEMPKMLIRQTGDCIVAGFDGSGFYHLNNVHSLTRQPHCHRSMGFMDGLMNSAFWLYIYRMKTREQGRALAQIDIETLESMPLPEEQPLLEKQIELLITFYQRAISNSRQVLAARISRAIDGLVYQIYELDDETIKQIEAGCGKLSDTVHSLPGFDELRELLNQAVSDEVVCASPSL